MQEHGLDPVEVCFNYKQGVCCPVISLASKQVSEQVSEQVSLASQQVSPPASRQPICRAHFPKQSAVDL